MNNSETYSAPPEAAPLQDTNSRPALAKPPWSPTAIAWICVLFMLLPAGVMYALNFERLGQPERKKHTLWLVLIGAVVYYLFIIRVVLLAESQSRATELSINLWIQIINIIIAWHFYLGQQKLFVRHVKQGGRKAPLLLPIALSSLWMLTIMAGTVGAAYLMESAEAKEFEKAVAALDNDRYEEAEVIFKKFKTRYPKDTNTRWNLALIYARTQRTSLAKRELEDLLKQEPDHKEARGFLRELEAP